MATLGTPLLLDGSFGEGGGALLRTAVVMSALTQQPLKLSFVRGGTKFPGLSAEDVTIVLALAKICEAETVGCEVGAQDLSFLPTRWPKGLQGSLEWVPSPDGWSVASAQVVAGSLVPVLARSGLYSSFSCEGETFGQGVLSYDYFHGVTLGAYKRFGLYAYSDLIRCGFGRGSRGEITVEVEPSMLNGIEWPTRGELLGVHAKITMSGLSGNVADRGVAHLERLAHNSNLRMSVEVAELPSESPGAFVTVWAEFARGFGGATGMGQKGLRMEAVVQGAFEGMLRWLRTDASVDPYLADQILLPLCFAEGDSMFSVSKLTPRLLTVVWVVKQFVPIRITVKGREGEYGEITIRK